MTTFLRATKTATAITHITQDNSPSDKEPGDVSPAILLAEDNLVNQKLVALLFRKLGFPVKIVSNGLEAVEEALRHSYNLIFMDIQMPEMNGIEATKVLKSKLGENCPAIVALTASAMAEDRQMIREAGMDDYIPKPIDFKKLNDTICRYALT